MRVGTTRRWRSLKTPSLRRATLGYRPLEAEALLALGESQDSSGDFKLAEQTLKQAVRAGLAAGHDAVVVRGWAVLVHVIGYQQARYGEGHEIARDAAAAAARRSDADGLVEVIDAHVALLLTQEGRYDEAADRYRTAVQGLRARFGADHLRLAPVLDALAMLHFDQGRLEDALVTFVEARDIRAKWLGPEHPALADSLRHIGSVHWAEGHFDQALAEYQQAAAVYQRTVGTEHLFWYECELNTAVILGDLERHPEALAIYERLLPSYLPRLDADHPDTARVLYNWGSSLRGAGRLDEARRELDRARAIWEKRFGAEHVDVAMALYELGELERDLGRYPQSERLLGQSLTIVERTVGPDHRGASFVLAALGHTRLAAGDPRGALAPLRRAEALQTADRLDAARVSDTRFALARALRSTRTDPARARQLATQAADGYRSTGERRAKRLAEVEAWLARPD